MLYTFEDQNVVNELKQNNNELNIISLFTDRLGITPEERQREVLRCESKRVIVNCSRQWGKSTLAGERTQGDGHNRISLRLANGSRIVGLPGSEGTVRGFSAVSPLIIDEASRVADEMYRALRPTLAVSDGDL